MTLQPLTPAARSRARNARAARILGGIALDHQQAAALARITAVTGETAAGWVRRMIAEQSSQIPAAGSESRVQT